MLYRFHIEVLSRARPSILVLICGLVYERFSLFPFFSVRAVASKFTEEITAEEKIKVLNYSVQRGSARRGAQ